MILLTGATGFLGAYLLRELVQQGYRIRATRRANSRLNLVQPYLDHAQVSWVECDMLDLLALDEAMQGVDRVVHAAAMVSFSLSDRRQMMRVNQEGTANIVNLCLEHGIEKLCHVSSIAAIGRAESGYDVTEDTDWQPGNHKGYYELSKHLAEMEVWRGIAEGLTAVMVNPSIILGAGYWEQGSPELFEKVATGLKFYATGRTGFVDVRDVARATVSLLESEVDNARFILNGDNLPYRTLFDTTADALGRDRPSVKVTPLIAETVWRLEWFRSKFTGKKPLITKETARHSRRSYTYDGSRILTALPDFDYTPIEQTIRDTAAVYQESRAAGHDYGLLG